MSLVKRNDQSYSSLPSIWDNFLNRDIFNWGSNFANSGNSVPSVNIKETPDSFEVELAAPGMEKKDFKVELDGNTLSISSERENQHEERQEENYTRKEFSYQSFYRTFHLPKDVVDAEKIKASKINQHQLRLINVNCRPFNFEWPFLRSIIIWKELKR